MYYYSLFRTEKYKELAQKVVDLVKEVRERMPRIGTRKLYHILKIPLKALKIGRDKLFRILEANYLLILPKRRYTLLRIHFIVSKNIKICYQI